MKSIITSGLLLGAAHGLMAPAIAGPYVNVESETGFKGGNYDSSVIHSHVGYEQKVSDSTTVYGQVGPSVVFEDGEQLSTRLGAKVGGKIAVNQSADVYGEVKMLTGTTNKYGLKAGVKYRF